MDTEVTIVGAGVTGLTMAALLIKNNISVSLVDKRKELDFSEDKIILWKDCSIKFIFKEYI